MYSVLVILMTTAGLGSANHWTLTTEETNGGTEMPSTDTDTVTQGPLACANRTFWGSSGVITSPNYPSHYNNNMACVYTIHHGIIYPNRLKFRTCDFDIEYSYSCTRDYLRFGTGARYCGTLVFVTPSVASWNGITQVFFVSNGNQTRRGFKIGYSTSHSSAWEMCSDSAQMTTESVNEVTESASSVTENHTNSSCGNQYMVGSYGFITTPNYPNNYNNDMVCVYRIYHPSLYTSPLHFYTCDCDIEYSFPCNNDFIRLGRNSTRLCGYRTGREYLVYPENGETEVTFVSNMYHTRRGCRIAYSTSATHARGMCSSSEYQTTPFVEEATEGPSWVTESNTSRVACANRTFWGSSGVITSPNYPNHYNNNMACMYTIDHGTIYPNLLYFHYCDVDIEFSYSCTNDYFRFGAGGRYCRSHNTGQTSSVISWNGVTQVFFVSNGNQTRRGFKIGYSTSRSSAWEMCSNSAQMTTESVNEVTESATSVTENHTSSSCGNQYMVGSYGFITTPNYPSNYNNDMVCVYRIYHPSLYTSPLHFYTCDCDIEYSFPCNNDFIRLGRNSTRLCGYRTGREYLVYPENGETEVTFVSNMYHTRRGCRIAYSTSATHARGMCSSSQYQTTPFVEEATEGPSSVTESNTNSPCGDLAFRNSYGIITTPNYPNGYKNSMLCLYTIDPPHTQSLGFRAYFYTCDCYTERNYDYIRFGTNTAKVWGAASRRHYSAFSYYGIVVVRFYSDASVTERGCKIAYSTRNALEAQNMCATSTYLTTESLSQVTESSPNVTPDLNTGSPDCANQTFFGSAGVITTPNYPSHYNNNIACTYTIHHRISYPHWMYFYFCDFDIQSSYNCLRFGRATSHCGSFYTGGAKADRSWDGITEIFFVSNGYQSRSGFKIGYSTRLSSAREMCSNSTYLTTESVNEVTESATSVTEDNTSSSCGDKYIRARSGYIITPNYPSNFSDDMACTYRITHPSQYSFDLYFFPCSCWIEPSYYCTEDFIQFGENSNRLCGRTMELPLVHYAHSQHGGIDVKFVSNGHYTKRGCQIAYSTSASSARALCLSSMGMHGTTESVYGGTGSPPWRTETHPPPSRNTGSTSREGMKLGLLEKQNTVVTTLDRFLLAVWNTIYKLAP